jgi:hypothetical protein
MSNNYNFDFEESNYKLPNWRENSLDEETLNLFYLMVNELEESNLNDIQYKISYLGDNLKLNDFNKLIKELIQHGRNYGKINHDEINRLYEVQMAKNAATKRAAVAERAAAANKYEKNRKKFINSKLPETGLFETNYASYDIKNTNSSNFGINTDGHFGLLKNRKNITDTHVIPKGSKKCLDWLESQTRYIEGLSLRDKITITNYTFKTDRLINAYLREGIKSLVREFNNVGFTTFKADIKAYFPFVVQIFDMFEELGLESILGKKDLFITSTGINYDGFNDSVGAIKISIEESLLEQIAKNYNEQLTQIIHNSPRCDESIYVYRGTKSLKYFSNTTYNNNDYLSTSINPYTTMNFMSENLATRIKCCLNELEITPDVPCLYISSVSRSPSEEEVLLPPNLSILYDKTMHIKKLFRDIKSFNNYVRGVYTRVGVLNGIVRLRAGAGAGAHRRRTRRTKLKRRATRKN